MQAANDLTMKAMRHAGERAKAGMTPHDFGAAIDAATVALGGSPEFALVLIDEAAALPHGSKKPQLVKRGALSCSTAAAPCTAISPTSREPSSGARTRRASSAKCGTRFTKASRSRSAQQRLACLRARSMTLCARPTPAGATVPATSCPACPIARATASAWTGTSRSTSSTARRRRSRLACASPTSRVSTFPASSESGSRIAGT